MIRVMLRKVAGGVKSEGRVEPSAVFGGNGGLSFFERGSAALYYYGCSCSWKLLASMSEKDSGEFSPIQTSSHDAISVDTDGRTLWR
jgi:hypothetical protein